MGVPTKTKKANTMRQARTFFFLSVFLFATSESFAQSDEPDLRIFGYFQSSFQHWTTEPGGTLESDRPAFNSFAVQQLNMFFQKDLAKDWRAFIGLEALNNFSTSRQWGSLNLEEAWVRHHHDERLNVKFGLQIPIFNHLNEIKNRTPILPYVIRPLVYETSFREFIWTEEFIPARAFLQAYGFLSSGRTKLDYAVYLGNSPNISAQPDPGPAGLDSTDTFLFGGRLGLRYGDLKLGVSTTYDKTNIFVGAEEIPGVGGPPTRFKEIPRIRLGGDGSYHKGRFSLEGEVIMVRYDDEAPEISIDKEFLYGNLVYHITDQWLGYVGYWFLEEDDITFFNDQFLSATGESHVATLGMAYNFNDRLTFKGQWGHVEFKRKAPAIQIRRSSDFDHFSMAASVFF